MVSTANNHALDRRWAGADRTIKNLKEAGLPFAGTKASTDANPSWYTITEAKGVKVAWVACSFSTNGIPDTKSQVLHCYEDKATLLATIRGLAGRPREVDAIIVTPHWGVEYNHAPEQQEKNLAHEMLDAGATAILGGHPHVVQPWEKYTTRDGREGFIIYSLGNFVSGQSGVPKRSSLILYVGLTKGSDGKVTVNGVRHMPLTMAQSPYTAKLATGESLDLTTKILGTLEQARRERGPRHEPRVPVNDEPPRDFPRRIESRRWRATNERARSRAPRWRKFIACRSPSRADAMPASSSSPRPGTSRASEPRPTTTSCSPTTP